MATVIVIGAGAAGLAAAMMAKERGHDVVVLEARDRLGGRAFTADVGPATIDLGAAWMHGHVGSPITELAERFGLTWRLDDSWDKGNRAYAGGWTEPAMAERATSIQWKWDPGAAAAHLGREGSQLEASDWFLDQFNLTQQERDLAEFRMRWIDAGTYTGGQADNISLRGSSLYREHPGGNAMIIGGYRLLINRMAHELDIRLAHVVQRIEHGESARVITNRGTFDADNIIVTVPLSVLQLGAIEFDPPLPSQASIDRLAMGRVEKIVLVYHERWWPTDHRRFMYVSDSKRTPQWLDLTSATGAPTLVAFYNEDDVVGWDGAGAEQRIADSLSIINEMFGEHEPPVAAHATTWSSDPFSLGSYSYIPVGASGDDMDELTKPQSNSLMLAGEHTVKEHFGTVHAAIESGYRAAKALLRE